MLKQSQELERTLYFSPKRVRFSPQQIRFMSSLRRNLSALHRSVLLLITGVSCCMYICDRNVQQGVSSSDTSTFFSVVASVELGQTPENFPLTYAAIDAHSLYS